MECYPDFCTLEVGRCVHVRPAVPIVFFVARIHSVHDPSAHPSVCGLHCREKKNWILYTYVGWPFFFFSYLYEFDWPLVYLIVDIFVGCLREMHGKWPVATCYFWKGQGW